MKMVLVSLSPTKLGQGSGLIISRLDQDRPKEACGNGLSDQLLGLGLISTLMIGRPGGRLGGQAAGPLVPAVMCMHACMHEFI